MKFSFIFFLLYVTFSSANEVDTRVNIISKNLSCLVCQGQSVYESNSDFAKDIKNYIKKEIMNNKSDKEIYDFLRTKYGESIIFNPTPSIKNIMLWLAPALFFLIGVYIIFRRLGASR